MTTDRRSHRHRRRGKWRAYLTCAALLGAQCLIYWALTSKRPFPALSLHRAFTGNLADPALRPASLRSQTRVVYPYSVIRGGAFSAAELEAAIRTDSVVAAHYAVFDRTRVHTVRAVDLDPVYVSYRQRDQVYWTRRKVRLAAAELLLTDGVNTARARCGNRISSKPMGPVQAVEPLAASLDTPEFTPTPIPIAGLPAVITPLTLAAQEIFPSPLGGWQPRAMPGGGGSSPAAVSPAAGFGYMSLPPSTGEPFPTGILMPQQPGTATPPGSPGTAPAVYQVLAFSSPTNGFLWIQPGQIPDGSPVPNLSYVLPPGEATVPQIVWLIPSLPILPGFPGLSGGSATVVSGPVLLSAPVVTVGLESPNTPGLPSYASTLSGPTLPPTGIVPPDEDTSADTPEPGSLALLLAGALLLTCSRAIHPR